MLAIVDQRPQVLNLLEVCELLPRLPARGGAPAHRLRAAQGGGARARPGGLRHRPRPPRRGDRPHPRRPAPAEAKAGLIAQFGMSEIQADEILKLQLQRLTGLERQKIVDELAEIRIIIADLQDILAKPARVDRIVAEELKKIREEHGDPRRTEDRDAVDEISVEDMIVDEDVVISITHTGYIKRTSDLDLPQPEAGRARAQGHADEGRGLRRPALHRLHPLLHPDLHRPRARVLAEGPCDPGGGPAGARQGGGEPREPGAAGEDRGLRLREVLRSRPLRAPGHPQGDREEDGDQRTSPTRAPPASSPSASRTTTP